jgi:hypothetical protein
VNLSVDEFNLVLALSKQAQVTASNFYSGYGSASVQSETLIDRQSNNLEFNSDGFAPQYVQDSLRTSNLD